MTWFSMLPWATETAGDGAARYTQERSNQFFRFFDVQDWEAEGVVKGSALGEFDIVDATLGNLTISGGAAICFGRVWGEADWNLEEADPIPVPVIGTTGGRIVLRADWSTNTIRPAWKISADGNVAIPALVQDQGNVWEISLYTFAVTTGGVITITDDRTYRQLTAEIPDNEVTPAKIANRTRSFLVRATLIGGLSPAEFGEDFAHVVPFASRDFRGIFALPSDYAGGDMTVKAVIARTVAEAGRIYMPGQVDWGGIGDEPDRNSVGNIAGLSFVDPPANLNLLFYTGLTIAAADIAAGDFFSVRARRVAEGSPPTSSNKDILFYGWLVEYEADS